MAQGQKRAEIKYGIKVRLSSSEVGHIKEFVA